MLERLESGDAAAASPQVRREAAEAKARRILAEELKRLRWTPADLQGRRKNDPQRLALAARLRKETILPVKSIAKLAGLGSSNSANANLHAWMRRKGNDE